MSRDNSPKLGILLPTRGIVLRDGSRPDPAPVLALAEQAEAAGMDSVWVGDSLVAKPRLEPLATLAAVAMRTNRVGLGTAVLLGPLRHPVLLAQTAATVDILSGGRLVLGMGVGGAFTEAQQQEWAAAGVPPQGRGSRMTELTQICQRLWTEDSVTFSGRHFNLQKTALDPKPFQHAGVPILLACHDATGSQAQYRRAGRYAAGVMGITDTPEQYGRVLAAVGDHAREAGRDADSLKSALYMTVNIDAEPEAALRHGDDFIQRYYGLNMWADKWGPFGPPEAVAERIVDYAREGAQEVIVRFASFEPEAQLARFVEKVVPLVRATTAPGVKDR